MPYPLPTSPGWGTQWSSASQTAESLWRWTPPAAPLCWLLQTYSEMRVGTTSVSSPMWSAAVSPASRSQCKVLTHSYQVCQLSPCHGQRSFPIPLPTLNISKKHKSDNGVVCQGAIRSDKGCVWVASLPVPPSCFLSLAVSKGRVSDTRLEGETGMRLVYEVWQLPVQ